MGPGREGVALSTGWGVLWGWRGGEAGRVSAGTQTDRNLTAWECAPGTCGWVISQGARAEVVAGRLRPAQEVCSYIWSQIPLPTARRTWGQWQVRPGEGVSAGKERESTWSDSCLLLDPPCLSSLSTHTGMLRCLQPFCSTAGPWVLMVRQGGRGKWAETP